MWALRLHNVADAPPHYAAVAPHPGKFICQHFSVNVAQTSLQEQEEDLNYLINARHPHFF
jgi:hypothetical protein